jgi:hypothetical protein
MTASSAAGGGPSIGFKPRAVIPIPILRQLRSLLPELPFLTVYLYGQSLVPSKRAPRLRVYRGVSHPNNNRRYSQDPAFVKQVLDLYVTQDLPLRDVVNALKVTPDTIYRILYRNGVKTRRKASSPGPKRYQTNDTFFQTIDTEEKAYYLGLFYADGCVSQYGPSNLYKSCISLTAADSYILHRLNQAVYGQQKPLFHRKSHYVKRSDGREYTEKASKAFLVYGTVFAKHLIAQGCFPRKSLTLQFPTSDQVPDHLLPHFIRGYFDGDGSITRIKGKNRQTVIFSIVSSGPFIDGLIQCLSDRFGCHMQKRSHGKVFYAVSSSRRDAKRFYGAVYANANIWLRRKRDRFEDLCQQVKHDDICLNLGQLWSQRFPDLSFHQLIECIGIAGLSDLQIDEKVEDLCDEYDIQYTTRNMYKLLGMRRLVKGDMNQIGRSRL